jgi:cyanophycinase-like exopeptidase
MFQTYEGYMEKGKFFPIGGAVEVQERRRVMVTFLEEAETEESEAELDRKLIAALEARDTPTVTLEVDENGSLIIDKDLHPELYDWAVNG